jgi:hypothetical protein
VTITQLQPYQDCRVVLRLNDGEGLTGEIKFVDLEYEDVVVDILETTCPERYAGSKNAVYVIKAADVLSVERIPMQGNASDE